MQVILKALSWTFLHSLWQGLLAALLAAIIISVTKKASARSRYNLLGTLLVLFLAAFFITFKMQLNLQEQDPVSALAFTLSNTDNVLLSSTTIDAPANAGLTAQLRVWFNSNADLLMLAWIIFFLLNCLKLMTGLATVRRLRYYKTQTAPVEWITKLEQLQERLNIRGTVQLLQSGLVKVPMALGILKPVILVPVGMLAHIPAEQVEAILLHELAHIRRKDYLVNLLQRFADAVFFFNPAFLWVSSLLRHEREACCDDIVVMNTAQKRNYVDALVAFQSYSLKDTSPAMAIGSRSYYLLDRVKRIMTNENKKLELVEKIALLIGVIIFSAFTIIKGKAEQKEEEQTTTATRIGGLEHIPPVLPKMKRSATLTVTPKKIEKKPVMTQHIIVDTLPVIKEKISEKTVNDKEFSNLSVNTNSNNGIKKQSIHAISADGVHYIVEAETGKTTRLSVNGKEIPSDQLGEWTEVLNRIYYAVEHRKKSTLQLSMEPGTRVKEAETNMKNTLEDIGNIKTQIGERKDRINAHREQMKNNPAMSENEKKALLDQVKKEQDEIDLKRTELEKRRADLEYYRESIQENKKDPKGSGAIENKEPIKLSKPTLFKSSPEKTHLFSEKYELKKKIALQQNLKLDPAVKLEKKTLLNKNIKLELKDPGLKLKQPTTDPSPPNTPTEPKIKEGPSPRKSVPARMVYRPTKDHDRPVRSV